MTFAVRLGWVSFFAMRHRTVHRGVVFKRFVRRTGRADAAAS
jgi:hypothetical protein